MKTSDRRVHTKIVPNFEGTRAMFSTEALDTTSHRCCRLARQMAFENHECGHKSMIAFVEPKSERYQANF